MQFGDLTLKQCRYGWMLFCGPFIGKCFELYGEYSECEVQAMRGLVRAGDVVLDIGANAGSVPESSAHPSLICGVSDDVIQVSGYRLGTAEIESALVSHPAVAEAAAIGVPHEVRGNVIHAYVILRAGFAASPALAEELGAHVSREMGPIARPERIDFVPSLPKTRSGKITRRLLKARAQGLPDGDISTLEE